MHDVQPHTWEFQQLWDQRQSFSQQFLPISVHKADNGRYQCPADPLVHFSFFLPSGLTLGLSLAAIYNYMRRKKIKVEALLCFFKILIALICYILKQSYQNLHVPVPLDIYTTTYITYLTTYFDSDFEMDKKNNLKMSFDCNEQFLDI